MEFVKNRLVKIASSIVTTNKVKYAEKRCIPLDLTPIQSFNRGRNGWCESVFTQLMKAQSVQELHALESQLNEFERQYASKDLSDVDMIRFCKPRTCQLPSELAEFTEAITQYRLNKSQAEEASKAAKEAADAAKAAVSVTSKEEPKSE